MSKYVSDYTEDSFPWVATGSLKAKAYRNATHSISVGYNKIDIDTKSFDSGDICDVTTNHRITPNIAGYYQVNAQTRIINLAADARQVACVFKNGSAACLGSYSQYNAESSPISTVSDIVYLNGSTDYVELYLYISNVDSATLDVGYPYSNYISLSGPIGGYSEIQSSRLGYLQRPVFGVTDGDTITIGPAVYHHGGTTDQFVYWNSTLTKDVTVTGTQWYYLYIDDSAIVTSGVNLLTANELTLVTGTPSYSLTNHGQYNSLDRCIMGFHVTDGVLDYIYHDGGDYVQYGTRINNRAWGDISDTELVTLTMPSFSYKAKLSFFLSTNANSYTLSSGPTLATAGILLYGLAGLIVHTQDTQIVSSSHNIYITLSEYTGTNNVRVDTAGWYFPTGM